MQGLESHPVHCNKCNVVHDLDLNKACNGCVQQGIWSCDQNPLLFSCPFCTYPVGECCSVPMHDGQRSCANRDGPYCGRGDYWCQFDGCAHRGLYKCDGCNQICCVFHCRAKFYPQRGILCCNIIKTEENRDEVRPDKNCIEQMLRKLYGVNQYKDGIWRFE